MQIKDFPNISILTENDLLLVQTASDGAFKNIKGSDLKAYFGGSGATTTSAQSIDLRYSFDGDTNGLVTYLGTSKGATAFTNPDGISLIMAASSTEYGSPTLLVNRTADEFYTHPAPNSWVTLHLLFGKLICNRYSIRARSNTDYYPRNWKLQGLDNSFTFVDLDTQVNNITLNSPSQWLSLPVTPTVAYSTFRILQYDNDSSNSPYLTLGELEFYGTYQS